MWNDQRGNPFSVTIWCWPFISGEQFSPVPPTPVWLTELRFRPVDCERRKFTTGGIYPTNKNTWSQPRMAGYYDLTTTSLLAKGKCMKQVLKNQLFKELRELSIAYVASKNAIKICPFQGKIYPGSRFPHTFPTSFPFRHHPGCKAPWPSASMVLIRPPASSQSLRRGLVLITQWSHSG